MYSLLTLVFSTWVFNPIFPKDYQMRESLEKSRVITFKEAKLNHLIKSMEYQMKKDSISIQSMKENIN